MDEGGALGDAAAGGHDREVALANAARLLNSYGIEVEMVGVAVASLDQAS